MKSKACKRGKQEFKKWKCSLKHKLKKTKIFLLNQKKKDLILNLNKVNQKFKKTVLNQKEII